jgi:hypothetical protein
MAKAGDFTIAKGDICGINANGLLTTVFDEAVSFVVKSTSPSYVGGDTWASVDVVGAAPVEPVLKGGNNAQEIEEDAVAVATYKAQRLEYEQRVESARANVDRIAFSGQVPVNVYGASAGQHIIPVRSDNGGIEGTTVLLPSFEQYQASVGKVIAIEADGRARIIVKIA